MDAPASSMTWRQSAKRGERKYASIRLSMGRLPLIGPVGLTPALSDARISPGECTSNAPKRSSSIGIDSSFLLASTFSLVQGEVSGQ